MNDDLFMKLRISPAAIELISMINFLFLLEDEKIKLVKDCEGEEGKVINRYVNNKRREIITNRLYTLDDFIRDWQMNQKSALERLFQEPLTDVKLVKLKVKDPILIYKIHNTQPHMRFMKFIMII
ncbi:hypothetical protein SAMN04488688_1067 [Paenibacillus sp. cl141a]|uniref:hypothetical protein n=1 Tax=Paenibacillus sp. cl141a TaxID=1761877 RepID=UPI0008BC5325|nr:hypothetical protein [Paenibacillus sp. cl141a]SEL80548.1 hypothetical protein SAMN04488688_1067 [Paenibacillus sp. cl141a]